MKRKSVEVVSDACSSSSSTKRQKCEKHSTRNEKEESTSVTVTNNSLERRLPPLQLETKKQEVLTNNEKINNNFWPPPFLGNGLYLTKVAELRPESNIRALSLFELVRQIRPIASIHFSFCVEPGWVLKQYSRSLRQSPISFIVGQAHLADLEEACKYWTNIQCGGAPLPFAFGTHHTKLSLFESETALHVVVGTANLTPADWTLKTQAFYHFRAPFSQGEEQSSSANGKAEGSDEKTTINQSFREDLIEYLRVAYPKSAKKAHQLVSYWLERIVGGQADFSQCRDRMIGSVPGRYYKRNADFARFGHLKLRAALASKFDANELPTIKTFIAQFSSIGSLGPKAESWLCDEFLTSLSGAKNFLPPNSLKLIYPTVENVRQSLEGYAAGFYLPYMSSVHRKQNYMLRFFHQWKSERHGRSAAMPHVKSYTGLDDQSEPRWLAITSANLSTSAWGKLEKGGEQLFIRSYELGVLLCAKDHQLDLLLPYDLPLVKYSPGDQPFIYDINYPELPPDSFGFRGPNEVREAGNF